MEEEGDVRSFGWRKFLALVVLIGFFWSIWFVFFSSDSCRDDQACFQSNLKDCSRATFVSGDKMIFRYEIKGRAHGDCEVDVTLLQGELDNADSKKLEGQVMTCMLPLGVIMSPESDISLCHGELKEGLQDLVIRKLHTYLVQNLGRLNLEMAGLPEA